MKSIYFIALLATLYGCSNREIYQAQQGGKQNNCARVVNDNERSECFDAANKSYDRYEQERNELLHK